MVPTSIAWRPDAACVTVGFSDGGIDVLEPELGVFTYGGAEVAATAPNKVSLRLRNFVSKNLGLPPGVLEL